MEYVPQTCIIQFFPAIEVQDSFQSHFLAFFPVVIIPMACFFVTNHTKACGHFQEWHYLHQQRRTSVLTAGGFLQKHRGMLWFPHKDILTWPMAKRLKLFGITYLGGKIKFQLFFSRVHWLSEYMWDRVDQLTLFPYRG